MTLPATRAVPDRSGVLRGSGKHRGGPNVNSGFQTRLLTHCPSAAESRQLWVCRGSRSPEAGYDRPTRRKCVDGPLLASRVAPGSAGCRGEAASTGASPNCSELALRVTLNRLWIIWERRGPRRLTGVADLHMLTPDLHSYHRRCCPMYQKFVQFLVVSGASDAICHASDTRTAGVLSSAG